MVVSLRPPALEFTIDTAGTITPFKPLIFGRCVDCNGASRVLFYSPTPVVPYCQDCNNRYLARLAALADDVEGTDEDLEAALYGVDDAEDEEGGADEEG